MLVRISLRSGYLGGHCAAIGRDVNEITCSVNVRVDPDSGLEPVVTAAAAWRDAGADLVILNLPHHVKPDSLKPLAEAPTPLALPRLWSGCLVTRHWGVRR